MKFKSIDLYKRFLSILLFCFSSHFVLSQQVDNLSNNLNTKINKKFPIGSPVDSLSMHITDEYVLPHNGIAYLFLQLNFKDIPVFGKIETLVTNHEKPFKFKNEKDYRSLVFEEFKGKRIVNADIALKSLFNKLKLTNVDSRQPPQMYGNNIANFGLMGIADSDVIVQNIWYPIKEGSYVLTWQIEITLKSTSLPVLYWINAYSLEIVAESDYTVEETLIQHDSTSIELIPNKSNESRMPSQSDFSTNGVLNSCYNVIPFPAENNVEATGIQFNPWLNYQSTFDANAFWHFDGIVLHDSTRGNNVWSQEDHDNNNLTKGRCALSQTPPPSLSFLYPYDTLQSPFYFNNQQFALTNLFYWCNILHDFFQLMGFDESSGNFQFYNYINGRANDGLIADAQDAGRFNNANITTPPDGISPRMQLYLFNKTIPFRDASLDNGIIVHEYTHGVTNRLTGGPSNSNCLNNAEQPGEGWSDYFALMLTTDWRIAGIDDGVIPRSIGTYVLGQQQLDKGIRDYYYTTNKAVNPLHYGTMAAMEGNAHKIGEIWCVTLWDLTWLLIHEYGIDSNIFDENFSGGNTIAMKLVLEGIRLQPCSPGFIDARNAILQADTIYFQGKYSCLIWKAFAGRGMGVNAEQGAANNTTDQTESFIEAAGVQIKSYANVMMQHEGMDVRVTHRITSGNCTSLINYNLTDTLPLNAAYVSGGSYDSSNRTVSFQVNISEGERMDYSFIYKIIEGTFYPKTISFYDSVGSSSIDSFWIKNDTSPNNWQVNNQQFTSRPYSFFGASPPYTADNILITKIPISLPIASAAELSFKHQYQLETGWDGGVVELSADSGLTWLDLGPYFISGYYDSKIKTSENALSGRFAFTGISTDFKTSRIDLSSWQGKSILLRFRLGTDESISLLGWFIDDVLLKDSSRVLVHAALSDTNGFVLANDKISVDVMPGLVCTCSTSNSGKLNAGKFPITTKKIAPKGAIRVEK